MSFPAYCAGFFDGEGNIDLRYRRTHGGKYERFELRVSIAQVDIRPLEMIKAEYGGSMCGPFGVSANVWRLVLTGSAARGFLLELRPFLIVKDREADVALDFYALVDATPPHTKPGQHRFSRTAQGITDQKIVMFHEMRAIRERKGLKAKHRKNESLGR